MSTWIIGYTGSGKSTFARRLSERFSQEILETGKFARDKWPAREDDGVRTLTAIAIDALKESGHRYFSKLIAAEIASKDLIIVGARNPVDFLDSFNPKKDDVIFLNTETPPATEFEEYGVNAIRAIVKFFVVTKIIKEEQAMSITADKENDDWYISSCSDF